MTDCGACGTGDLGIGPVPVQMARRSTRSIGSGAVTTRVYRSAEDLPSATTSSADVQPETNVQLLDLGDGGYCLNHALRQQQLFGGTIVRDAWTALRSGSMPVDPTLAATLISEGFAATRGDPPDRFHRELLAHEDAKEKMAPGFTLLRILLTDVCNLSCSYCKVIPNIDAPLAEPTDTDRLSAVVEFFFANSNEHTPKIIHVSGGEPTLFFDQVEHIVHTKERLERPGENCWVVMGTNATRITKGRARFLADHDVKCIVSMDGPEQVHDTLRRNHGGHGSWRAVDSGVRRLKEAGAEVSLSMVLGRHNLDDAHDTIEWFLDEYEPTGLGVNFMKPPTPDQRDYAHLVGSEDYARRMYGIHQAFRDRGLFLELVYRKLQPFVTRRYRYHDCGAAGGTNLNVDAKGNIGPCKSFLVMNKLALGELDAVAYRDLVVSRWRKRSPVYYDHCTGCPARGMCGNGCAYEAAVHSGDEMAIDLRSCEYTKVFNQLMIDDLYGQVRPPGRVQPDWWHVPTDDERQALLGKVEARPHTLSYSIGHQTID